MAEEPAATPVDTVVAPPVEPAVPAEPKAEPPEENLVGEAKRKQKAAEKERDQLLERLEALEDRDKSETERERKAREKAEARAAELDTKVQRMERGGWLRAAASAVDFEDPSDAEAFIDLADIESEADAKRAVKSLAERKPKLLKSSDPTPQIGRILQDGKAVTPRPEKAQATAEAEMVSDALKQFVRR